MAKVTKRNRITCDQCQLLSINGLACHEHGCPNSRKTWDAETGTWRKVWECRECGCTVQDDSECCGILYA